MDLIFFCESIRIYLFKFGVSFLGKNLDAYKSDHLKFDNNSLRTSIMVYNWVELKILRK